MSSPAPGFPRLPNVDGHATLEYTRTVAELANLSVALNQSGLSFELVDARPHLVDIAPQTHAFAGRSATVTLLPMDSAGDTSLRLIAFCLQHTLPTAGFPDESEGESDTGVDGRADGGDVRPSPVAIEAMAATLADQLPIGTLSVTNGQDLCLDYTLAVDALGAVPSDIVVDVVHLLDDLFTSALRRLHTLVEADVAAFVRPNTVAPNTVAPNANGSPSAIASTETL